MSLIARRNNQLKLVKDFLTTPANFSDSPDFLGGSSGFNPFNPFFSKEFEYGEPAWSPARG